MAAVMYPDFLIFRQGRRAGVIVDMLEPHAPNQGDLAPKLGGLCKFAEYQGSKFGRIESIMIEGARGKERILRLNVNDEEVRRRARLLTENPQVVALAKELNA